MPSLLELPIELRIKIYEELSASVSFQLHRTDPVSCRFEHSVKFPRGERDLKPARHFNTSILLVSRQIHSEVKPYLFLNATYETDNCFCWVTHVPGMYMHQLGANIVNVRHLQFNCIASKSAAILKDMSRPQPGRPLTATIKLESATLTYDFRWIPPVRILVEFVGSYIQLLPRIARVLKFSPRKEKRSVRAGVHVLGENKSLETIGALPRPTDKFKQMTVYIDGVSATLGCRIMELKEKEEHTHVFPRP